MGLNESRGNMYSFITHVWNAIKGACPYGCSYCYMNKIYKRFGKTPAPVHLDERELKTNLGKGNFIFVGSSCDVFADDIPADWIAKIRNQTLRYPDNKYLWHTKNPQRLVELIELGPTDVACVTIESDITHPGTGNAPLAWKRALYLGDWEGRRMITVEPVMRFNPLEFAALIVRAQPEQVNIGADSGRNGLPEPTREDLEKLIGILKGHSINVHLKNNLNRLLAA